MADGTGRGSQEYHQGFNAAAFFGLWALLYCDVISGGMFAVLMISLIGYYIYRHP